MTGPHFKIAHRAYIYAVAGSLALQMAEDEPSDYQLAAPRSLKLIPELDRSAKGGLSGFQAATFMYNPASSDAGVPQQQIIVAFTGTNEGKDWFKHNLAPFPNQFDLARGYLKAVEKHFGRDKQVVVTGFSLGGGLASHVLRHDETRALVKEAWLFNTSPRDGLRTDEHSDVYSIWAKGEILNDLRKIFFKERMGAPELQYEEYSLISASSVWLHARWNLTRQLLWLADGYEFDRAHRPDNFSTEALSVLEASPVPHALPGTCKIPS